MEGRLISFWHLGREWFGRVLGPATSGASFPEAVRVRLLHYDWPGWRDGIALVRKTVITGMEE